jgi:Ribbon-helix-helix domain
MTTISLRIPDKLLTEVTQYSKEMNIPRTEYIRKSLIEMNHQMELKMRRKRLMDASRRVREESMKVNAEFDAMEYSKG